MALGAPDDLQGLADQPKIIKHNTERRTFAVIGHQPVFDLKLARRFVLWGRPFQCLQRPANAPAHHPTGMKAERQNLKILLFRPGTGTDETHFAFENIEKLGQFIEIEFS